MIQNGVNELKTGDEDDDDEEENIIVSNTPPIKASVAKPPHTPQKRVRSDSEENSDNGSSPKRARRNEPVSNTLTGLSQYIQKEKESLKSQHTKLEKEIASSRARSDKVLFDKTQEIRTRLAKLTSADGRRILLQLADEFHAMITEERGKEAVDEEEDLQLLEKKSRSVVADMKRLYLFEKMMQHPGLDDVDKMEHATFNFRFEGDSDE